MTGLHVHHGHDHAHHRHGPGHHHGHHAHAPAHYDRAFAIGIALNTLFIVFEVVYGWRASSLALLSDAGHNVSDVLGLVIAWGAAHLGRVAPTPRRTYGLRGTSLLAALANALLLLVAVGAVAWEAIGRVRHPVPVQGTTVMWIAGLGIVVNTATALLFASGRKGDINVRGAYVHMAADAAVSAGVVVAGAFIAWTGALWIDPVVSLVLVAVITWGTWGLLRESLDLVLHAVPAGIDSAEVEAYLAGRPGVTAVHDLHIWAMSTTETALTAHLIRPAVADDDAFLVQLYRDLHDRFHIAHATVQIERGRGPHVCKLAPGCVV